MWRSREAPMDVDLPATSFFSQQPQTPFVGINTENDKITAKHDASVNKQPIISDNDNSQDVVKQKAVVEKEMPKNSTHSPVNEEAMKFVVLFMIAMLMLIE